MSVIEHAALKLSRRLGNYLRYDRKYHPGGDRVFWSVFDSAYWLLLKITAGMFGKRRFRKIQQWLRMDAAFERIRLPGRDRLLLRRVHRGVIRDIYDKEIYNRNGLDEGDQVVDVGAHWGAFTLWASRRIGPKGHVVAIEPDPANFRKLQDNVRRNRLENVTLIHAGLWDTAGKGGMTVAKGPAAAQMESIDPAGGEIPLMTLDQVLEQHPLPRLRHVKLDVEGAELRVLQGGKTTIKRGPDFAMEVHPQDVDAEAVESLLKDNGYTLDSDRGTDLKDLYILWAKR